MKEMQINESKIKEKRADLEKDYKFMSCFVGFFNTVELASVPAA